MRTHPFEKVKDIGCSIFHVDSRSTIDSKKFQVVRELELVKVGHIRV